MPFPGASAIYAWVLNTFGVEALGLLYLVYEVRKGRVAELIKTVEGMHPILLALSESVDGINEDEVAEALPLEAQKEDFIHEPESERPERVENE